MVQEELRFDTRNATRRGFAVLYDQDVDVVVFSDLVIVNIPYLDPLMNRHSVCMIPFPSIIPYPVRRL